MYMYRELCKKHTPWVSFIVFASSFEIGYCLLYVRYVLSVCAAMEYGGGGDDDRGDGGGSGSGVTFAVVAVVTHSLICAAAALCLAAFAYTTRSSW